MRVFFAVVIEEFFDDLVWVDTGIPQQGGHQIIFELRQIAAASVPDALCVIPARPVGGKELDVSSQRIVVRIRQVEVLEIRDLASI